jgi:hypothetical protein
VSLRALLFRAWQSFLFLSFLIVTNPAFCRADTPAQNQSEKTEIVNQQLDSVENYQANAGSSQESPNIEPNTAKVFPHLSMADVEKQFPNLHPDARKESPNVQPPRASAGAMLKDSLNPDLFQNPQPKSMSNVKTRVNTFDMGGEIFYYRYQEPSYVTMYGNTEPDVKIRGPMYGGFIDYTYRPSAPNLLNNFLTSVYFLQARYATSSDLEYIGSGIAKGKHDDVDEFRGLIGKDFFIGRDTLVTPYFGFGYRYLFDHGDDEITSSRGYMYDRKSHYYYLPLGANVAFDMPKNWEIDLNAEYDIFIEGWQKTYLTDGNQFGWDNTDLANRQDNGYGIRGSIKFLKKGSLVDFYVEPYIRYWNIEQSKGELISIDNAAPLIYGEPANNTVEVGTKFGIQF